LKGFYGVFLWISLFGVTIFFRKGDYRHATF
jgi:hypothetical protein